MLSYQADAEAAGCMIAVRTPVLEGALVGRAIQLCTGGPSRRSWRLHHMPIARIPIDRDELVVSTEGAGRADITSRHQFARRYKSISFDQVR